MDARPKPNDVELVPLGSEGLSPAEVAGRIFHRSSHPSIRVLRCSFHNGVLTLGGCVPSYYLKQLAQTAAQEVQGVRRVDNRIEVTSS